MFGAARTLRWSKQQEDRNDAAKSVSLAFVAKWSADREARETKRNQIVVGTEAWKYFSRTRNSQYAQVIISCRVRPCPLHTPPVATIDRGAGRKGYQTRALRGSKSRNKVSVGKPEEGSLPRRQGCVRGERADERTKTRECDRSGSADARALLAGEKW